MEYGFLRNRIKQLFIIMIFMSSCGTPSDIMVTNIRDKESFENTDYLYALPLTTFKIQAEATRKIYKTGPYRHFAKKFLGITEVIEQNSIEWELTSFEISLFPEPDPSHYYMIETKKSELEHSKLQELMDEGLIMGLTQYCGTGFGGEQFINPKPFETRPFTDLSVKRNLVERIDTSYRTVFRDSAFIRIPRYQRELKDKSLEEKAEEAANFIIKIRKRRFKLLAGQYDVFPEGTALETSVRELNALEKEYLSLFMGKLVEEKYTREMYITPSKDDVNQKMLLFRFSSNEGYKPANDTQGEPVYLGINPLNRTLSLKKPDLLPEDSKASLLYYRIPDLADIEISYGNKTIAQGRYPVFQLGEMAGISVDNYLSKKEK